MKEINDAVKWICGMGLVLIALYLIAQFALIYNQQGQANLM